MPERGPILPAVDEPARQVLVAIDEVDDAERALQALLRARLSLGSTDLAAVQWIDAMDRRGQAVRIRDLAARFRVTSGAATEIVNRLERRGVLLRHPDPADGRGRIICLTEPTRDALEGLVGEVRGGLDDLLQRIPESERTRIVALLGEVRDILLTPVAS